MFRFLPPDIKCDYCGHVSQFVVSPKAILRWPLTVVIMIFQIYTIRSFSPLQTSRHEHSWLFIVCAAVILGLTFGVGYQSGLELKVATSINDRRRGAVQ